MTVRPPSEPQPPKSGASTRANLGLADRTDSTPLARAGSMVLSAGPPLMTATLPPSGSAVERNSPFWRPMASLSGPIQLVYSPGNLRSTRTTGLRTALRAVQHGGADSSGPPEMMTASTFLASRCSTLLASLAASPLASVLMISMLPVFWPRAAIALSMPLK